MEDEGLPSILNNHFERILEDKRFEKFILNFLKRVVRLSKILYFKNLIFCENPNLP